MEQVTFTEGKMIHFNTYLKPDPTYYFGYNIIGELGKLINEYSYDKVFLVTNEVLHNLYGDKVEQSLKDENINYEVIVIADTEHDKTFTRLEELCELLVKKGITKGSIIVGVGGGCLTNIVGLASAMIYRGIRYIEMPTTFMGVTDSCLSNKQAVNGKQGKNQYGVYYAPIFIFSDTQFLATESMTGRKSAFAEGIKNAFINDESLLNYYEGVLATEIFEDMDILRVTQTAYCVIQSKLEILKQDPSEKLFAMALEYGHTFGHAMEFYSGGKIPHGIAVAKGMAIAAELSHELGYLTQEEVDKHYRLFGECLGLDLRIPQGISVENIMHTILADNKKTVKGVKYVLLKKIGECLNPDGDFQVKVDEATVKKILVKHNSVIDQKLGKGSEIAC
ncbi:2-deoxy-scyllo-inosose synthase [Eubacterium oxidoreducens]|uniref:3-dehydroquinate synthase n=1 Tax=Eubacterium oxidoreducens TaxID=1732 RepID=A0A1G6AUB5_EUBOX|nr:2-deoxy-scyllo-inosose synthase [Eubacterium oxidoreducens]SDB11813.1 3-dehydroquinate synthase [Eubacterium oxidoreducens]